MSEPATRYAELEIILDRGPAGAYQVEWRFTNPLNAAKTNPEKGDVRFDLAALLADQSDPKEYGKALASMLFADQRVVSIYRRVVTEAEAMNLSLRVQVLVGPAVPELNRIR